VLYVTTYLKDTALFTGLTRVRTEWFPQRYPPGALVVCDLLHPEILVEIAVVAAAPTPAAAA
jgi:enamine deaminase RidA (YjgF/YER057c/UK114 family)